MWLWLVGGIVAEVTATLSLRYSVGFTRLVPTVIVIAGYVFALYALSQALARGMLLGVAYGTWSACGIAVIALISALFLGEHLTWVQTGGLGLIIVGVLALELGGSVQVE